MQEPTINDWPPEIVECFRQCKSRGDYIGEAASAILAAPCGIRAVSSLCKRLKIEEVEIVLDAVVATAARNFPAVRYNSAVVRGTCKDIADSARTLMSTLHMVKGMPIECNVHGENLELLGVITESDLKEKMDWLASVWSVATAAADEPYQPINCLYDATGREENHLATFVRAVDSEIKMESEEIRVSHSEMAGLAWAVIDGYDDKSPVINTHDEKDKRAELVRKIRAEK